MVIYKNRTKSLLSHVREAYSSDTLWKLRMV